MTFTPNNLAANRTARLVAEAKTPKYTTSTPIREHLMVVEMESTDGYRFWSGTMAESRVNEYIDGEPTGAMLSDVDHAGNCWCGGKD